MLWRLRLALGALPSLVAFCMRWQLHESGAVKHAQSARLEHGQASVSRWEIFRKLCQRLVGRFPILAPLEHVALQPGPIQEQYPAELIHSWIDSKRRELLVTCRFSGLHRRLPHCRLRCGTHHGEPYGPLLDAADGIQRAGNGLPAAGHRQLWRRHRHLECRRPSRHRTGAEPPAASKEPGLHGAGPPTSSSASTRRVSREAAALEAMRSQYPLRLQ